MPAALRWLLRLVPTNPIVVRLVQGGSRRSRHNMIRMAYLAVLIAVLMILLLPKSGGQAVAYSQLARDGAVAFQWVAYLQVALICILSPVFMAGAIAQESNPRTWEVLLTTPLTSLQMVLGHLFGRLFFVFALLIASLPLFAITQYFGGVPGRTILLSYAIAGGAALVVGSIAVMLSVSRLAGRRAVFAFYVSVITYLALTFAIDGTLKPGGAVSIMTALNPFLALRALLNPAGYPGPSQLDLSQMSWLARHWLGEPVTSWVALTTGLSLVLVTVSTLLVRRAGASGAQPGLSSRGPRNRAPRTVWHNPVAWREGAARQATLPRIISRWVFIAIGATWGIALVAAYHRGTFSHGDVRFALLSTVWTELIVIVLIAVNVSATAISREREDGTLDLLLTTPITPAIYLAGKLRGVISYLTPLLAVPILTVAVMSLYVFVGGFGRTGGIMVTDMFRLEQIEVPVILPEAALIAPLITLPFVAFCVMVGLQWSMKTRGTIASVVATVGLVGIVAGIIGLCGWQAGAQVPLVGPAFSASTPLTALNSAINPASAYSGTVENVSQLNAARWSLVIGATISAGAYTGIVYGIRANMVRTFDMTVRKLAGTT